MKRSLSIVISLVAFAAAVRAAHATFFHTSGSACVKSNTAIASGQLLFGGWRGATNMSTTTDVGLTCPISFGYSARDGNWSIANGSLSIEYFDDSTSADFDCWVYKAYWDGSWNYTNPKYTCSVNGYGSGCSINNYNSGWKAYTGTGSISWSGTELNQFGVGSIDMLMSYEVLCTVPRRTGGEGSGIISVVASYGDT